LIEPIRHIRLRSFAHRRARSIMLFIAGYAAIWMALGGVLLSIDLAARLLQQSYLVAGGMALIASVWQFSPIKQQCLNRCHARAGLAAFGVAADFDALRFGMTHGIWCAGSCWALMLFAMVLPRGHVLAMAAVAVLVFSERLEQPTPPCWRLRGLGRAIRIVVVHARIHLQALPLASRAQT
jgi:predicted metal-binding membrane protein